MSATSTDRRRAWLRPRAAPVAAAAAIVVMSAALLAACNDGPGTLPDQPRIQLSISHLEWEMDAFDAASLTPLGMRAIGISSSGSLPGAPTVSVEYLDIPDRWLGAAVLGRTVYTAIPAPAQGGMAHTLAGGTYRARVVVAWQGAANSPATVDLALTVRPHRNTWALGEPVLQRYRANHTLTALDDGGALVVGGRDLANSPQDKPPAVLGTIERMDPATGVWSTAGTLRHARERHTATRLPDGRVLIAGGENEAAPSAPPDATWEIWDPQADGGAGAITEEGSLVRGRYEHAAVLLSDGRVLLVGGWNREEGPLGGARSCEVFDPGDPVNPVKLVGSLHGDAAESTPAVRLTDGRVLVLNDMPLAPGATVGVETGAELFDPETDSWTQIASRPEPGVLNGLAALPGGKALLFGGMYMDPAQDPTNLDALTYRASSYVYDPTTNAWSRAGSLHAPRLMIRDDTVVLPDGRVLVAGGMTNIVLGVTSLVEVFDPVARTWSVSGSLTTNRAFHTVSLLDDDSLLSVGGFPDNAGFGAERWPPPVP